MRCDTAEEIVLVHDAERARQVHTDQRVGRDEIARARSACTLIVFAGKPKAFERRKRSRYFAAGRVVMRSAVGHAAAIHDDIAFGSASRLRPSRGGRLLGIAIRHLRLVSSESWRKYCVRHLFYHLPLTLGCRSGKERLGWSANSVTMRRSALRAAMTGQPCCCPCRR